MTSPLSIFNCQLSRLVIKSHNPIFQNRNIPTKVPNNIFFEIKMQMEHNL